MTTRTNLPPESKYMAKDFFIYQIGPIATLAPAATLPGTVTLDADADFLWQKFTGFVQVGADGTLVGTDITPGITITIKDTASGRDLMNKAVPLPAIMGSGQLPFILPTPKIFQSRGTIAVQVQNITDDITYSALYLEFVGTKLFLK